MREPSYGRQCRARSGFTLIEVMISLAVIGGLLVTLLYTLNTHLSVAGRHVTITVATMLAKGKLAEMEKGPASLHGNFPEPHADYSFETTFKDSAFPGLAEISVTVKNGPEQVNLSGLILKPK